MPRKTGFNPVFDSQVAANTTDTQQGPVVPNGKTIMVSLFGGSTNNATNSYALEWGNGTTWVTVRRSFGNSDLSLNRLFRGDGVKRFRVTRTNATAAASVIVAWVDAFVNDA